MNNQQIELRDGETNMGGGSCTTKIKCLVKKNPFPVDLEIEP